MTGSPPSTHQFLKSLLVEAQLTEREQIQYLLNRGREYDNAERQPAEMLPANRCYENAYQYAEKYRLKYCEGYACGGPLQHAWCLDDGDNVVDPTIGAFYDLGAHEK